MIFKGYNTSPFRKHLNELTEVPHEKINEYDISYDQGRIFINIKYDLQKKAIGRVKAWYKASEYSTWQEMEVWQHTKGNLVIIQ